MLRNGKIGVKNVLSITKHNHSAAITVNTYTGTIDIQEAASRKRAGKRFNELKH